MTARILSSANPSRYYFVLAGPRWAHDDKNGVLLSDDNAAVAYAHRLVRELKRADDFNEPGLKMVVKNAVGDVVQAIPL